MKEHIVERMYKSAFYIINHKSTIRETAKAMRVSKTTTHLDLQDRLQKVDPALHRRVSNVIDWNLSERHIRGGATTKKRIEEGLI